jgi:hypothetical protein
LSNYIADPKYNGTLERKVALIIDHDVIYAGRYKGQGKQAFVLLDEKKGWDGIVKRIVDAVRESPVQMCHYQIFLFGKWRTLYSHPSKNVFPHNYIDTYKYQRTCWWLPNRRWYWTRKA